MARRADGSVQRPSLNSLSVHAAVELLSDGRVAHCADVERRLAKGPGVSLGDFVSTTMAKFAVRSGRVAALSCLAVLSDVVFARFLRVAPVAVWLRDTGWMGVLFVANVAGRTRYGGVSRTAQFLPLVMAGTARGFSRCLRPARARNQIHDRRQNDAHVLGAHNPSSRHKRLAPGSSWPTTCPERSEKWPCHEVVPESESRALLNAATLQPGVIEVDSHQRQAIDH